MSQFPPVVGRHAKNSLDAAWQWAFDNANSSALLHQMSTGSILGLVLGTTLLFCTSMNQLLVLVVAAKSVAAARVDLSVLDAAFDSVAMVPRRKPMTTIGETAAQSRTAGNNGFKQEVTLDNQPENS